MHGSILPSLKALRNRSASPPRSATSLLASPGRSPTSLRAPVWSPFWPAGRDHPHRTPDRVDHRRVVRVAVRVGQGLEDPAEHALPLHRFQRLYSVLCGSYSGGASHHRNPLRLTKIRPPGPADRRPWACLGASAGRAGSTSSAAPSAGRGFSFHCSIFSTANRLNGGMSTGCETGSDQTNLMDPEPNPRLAVGNGAPRFRAVLCEVYDATLELCCRVHRMVNVLNAMPKREWARANDHRRMLLPVTFRSPVGSGGSPFCRLMCRRVGHGAISLYRTECRRRLAHRNGCKSSFGQGMDLTMLPLMIISVSELHRMRCRPHVRGMTMAAG